jgi:hypothetical protein
MSGRRYRPSRRNTSFSGTNPPVPPFEMVFAGMARISMLHPPRSQISESVQKTSRDCKTSPDDYLHYRISMLPFLSHFSIEQYIRYGFFGLNVFVPEY